MHIMQNIVVTTLGLIIKSLETSILATLTFIKDKRTHFMIIYLQIKILEVSL